MYIRLCTYICIIYVYICIYMYKYYISRYAHARFEFVARGSSALRTYLYMYIHTYIHTYIHVYIRI